MSEELSGKSKAELFGFLLMPDAFFVCLMKYRTLSSKQRTNYGDPLWLYPTIGLASSLKNSTDLLAFDAATITYQSLIYDGFERNQGAFLSGAS